MYKMKMKLLLLTVFGVLFIIACKKEKIEDKSKDRLQGNWEVEQKIDIEYVNDKEKDRDTTKYKTNEIVFGFTGDSLVIYKNNKPGNRGTYMLLNDELIFRNGSNGDFFKLKWYTATRMGLILDETYVRSSGEKRRNFIEYICNKK